MDGVGDVEGRHRAPATASARAGLRHQFDSGDLEMWQAGIAPGEGNHRLGGWVHVAKQNVGNGLGATNARIPGFQHGAGLVKPRHGYGAAGFQHNHGGGVGGGYGGHQRVLVVRQREAGDVAAFAGGLVAEYDGDVRRLSQRRRRNRVRPGVVFHLGVRRFGANRLQR
jgi:hypothetical protein